MRGGGVKRPEQWKELTFDKIVICTANCQNNLQMMNQLLDLGVDKRQIGFLEEYQTNYEIDKIEVVGKNTIIFHTKNVAMRCENAVEYMIAKDIFASEDYGFHAKGKYYVIDIGMNIGCASLYFAAKEEVTAVYAFEPSKAVYDKAVFNINMNRNEVREKVHTYNVALGGRSCTEKYLKHDGMLESAGIIKIQTDTLETDEDVIEVQTVKASHMLDDIFKRHDEKCLLKLDCEGAEYDILEDLISSEAIVKIDTIIMEWHIGKYHELGNLLERAGFQYLLTKESRNFGKCYAWR